jgi:hypothetical protein
LNHFDGNLIVGNPGMEFAGHRRSRVCSIAGAHVVADFDLSCGFNGTTEYTLYIGSWVAANVFEDTGGGGHFDV